MTCHFDVDIRFCAQYGIRKSHIAKTVVHNLPWLWITILCSPIKGFGSDFQFNSWLCNLRESLPNHCCRWLSWEWNQWLKVLIINIPNASVMEILLCCASVMEILLCCASVMDILLCCSKPNCERLKYIYISIIWVPPCKLTALSWLNRHWGSCCLSLNQIYKMPFRMFGHTEITRFYYHTIVCL